MGESYCVIWWISQREEVRLITTFTFTSLEVEILASSLALSTTVDVHRNSLNTFQSFWYLHKNTLKCYVDESYGILEVKTIAFLFFLSVCLIFFACPLNDDVKSLRAKKLNLHCSDRESLPGNDPFSLAFMPRTCRGVCRSPSWALRQLQMPRQTAGIDMDHEKTTWEEKKQRKQVLRGDNQLKEGTDFYSSSYSRITGVFLFHSGWK